MVRVTPEEVLATWQGLVGWTLSPPRAEEFLARPEISTLGRHQAGRLRTAGAELHRRSGQLLLAQWARECAWDGGGTVTLDWARLAVSDADAVTVARDLVAVAVAGLPRERDRTVLAQRLGLDGDAALPLRDIGAGLHLSGERVRQVQDRAVGQLCRRHTPPSPGNYAGQVIAGVISEAADDGAEPAAALLTLAVAVCPGMPTGFAVQLLARLAGHNQHASRHLTAEVMTLLAVRRAQLARVPRQARSAELAAERVGRMLQHAEWPGGRDPAPPRSAVRPQRATGGDEAGTWQSAKLGRAVAYESVAELALVRMIDQAPQVLWFCEQPAAIGYAFGGRHRTYYPDLLLATDDGACVLVEVKVLAEMPLAVNQAKAAAARAFCGRHGWGYLLTDASGRTLRDLARLAVPELAGQEFTRALRAAGTLGWRDVKAQRDRHGLTATQVSALALQRGWDVRLDPYRVSEGVSTALTG
jgi:hypothetical protein